MENRELAQKLESIVGKGNVVHTRTGLLMYEYGASLNRIAQRIIEICKKNRVRKIEAAAGEEKREKLWAGRLEGIREAVARQIADINSLTDSEGATEISILQGPEEGDYWKQVGRLGLEVRNRGAWGIGLKASVPISRAPEICKAMGEEAEKIDVSRNRLTHAGSGIVYIHIPLPEGLYRQKQEALTRMVIGFMELAKDMVGRQGVFSLLLYLSI